jgi:selenide,water dikinase
VLINAFKADKIGEAELEPVLVEMERLNAVASRLALEHGAHAATDVTGFALAGHALSMARASGVGIRIEFEHLPVHDGFFRLVKAGVSTGCTDANERNTAPVFVDRYGFDRPQREVLFDPQTSGGLLLATPPDRSDALLTALHETGHHAADIGEVLEGSVRIEVV